MQLVLLKAQQMAESVHLPASLLHLEQGKSSKGKERELVKPKPVLGIRYGMVLCHYHHKPHTKFKFRIAPYSLNVAWVLPVISLSLSIESSRFIFNLQYDFILGSVHRIYAKRDSLCFARPIQVLIHTYRMEARLCSGNLSPETVRLPEKTPGDR